MRPDGVKHAMQRKPDIPYWNASLDRPVPTEDGSELHSLHEAATFIEARASQRGSLVLDAAGLSLEQAAESGHGADIAKARRMIELALEDIMLHPAKRA